MINQAFHMRKLSSILLVDDDNASNFLNKTLIEDLEVAEKVVISKNGREALNFISSCSLQLSDAKESLPEVILLDLNMPVMDGFEFLEEFEKLKINSSKSVLIFLLTSSSNSRDIEKARQYTVAGYLNKPLTEEKVIGILDKQAKA
jgi:CheY-like chemotaxis protein